MYFFDFLKRLFQKKNIMVIVYMIANLLMGTLILTCIFNIPTFLAGGSLGLDYVFSTALLSFTLSLTLYVISLLVILSPLGEQITRLKYKCKKIERADQISHIERMYQETLDKAKAVDETLNTDVNVYVVNSQETTVFALGRSTMAVTEGLFTFPEEKIKALMARELGHISQKDTDLLLLITSGNVTVTMCIWLIRIVLYILLIPVYVIGGFCFLFGMLFSFMASLDSSVGLRAIGKVLELICKPVPWIAKKLFELVGWIGKTLTNIWNKAGMMMLSKVRQEYEYLADEFAFNCGYGDVLCDIIRNDNLSDQSEGIFKNIVDAYPSADSRIAKLQILGVEYSEY